jgi:NTE family protein
MIKNLAIKGGGVKGVAYVGAIKELDKANLYEPLQRVSGTSAGALMAFLICAGFSVAALEELMKSVQFNKFKNGWNPLRIFTGYGLYSGDYILNFVQEALKKSPKKLKPNASFQDMRNAGCKDLYVFACNTSMHTVTEFSADMTPEFMVAEAVRASMSIPFFFKAWQFSHTNANNHIYIDGGIVYNYPLSFFDDDRFNSKGTANEESIGLYLITAPRTEPVMFNYSQPLFFTKHLFESLLEAQDCLIIKDKEQVERSIMIDDLNIPATDFNIKPEQMNALMDSGSKATIAFIAKLNAR